MALAPDHDGEHDVGLGDVLHQLDRLAPGRGSVKNDQIVAVVADAADIKRFVPERDHGGAHFLILIEPALEIRDVRHQLLEHALRRRRNPRNRDVARDSQIGNGNRGSIFFHHCTSGVLCQVFVWVGALLFNTTK